MTTTEMVKGALVSAFVERTFDTLVFPFVHIFRATKHNKKQLSDLKMKLQAVDVVAFDAEQKQFTDPRVKDWLLRAKNVVFDAEDLLDEINNELYESQVEAGSQSATKKVWNSLKSSFVSFFANEIESRMQQIIEELEDLATQSHFLGLKKASGVGFGSGSASKLIYTSLPNESVIYGRDDDKEFVLNWLTSDTDKKLSILSIVGMGGLGKTSLAQHVFNDPRIEGKFDIKVWVSVPQEFDVLCVSRAILDAITKSTDDSRDLEMVHRRLKENLTAKKFLLVLDDVWNENQSKWEQVQKALGFGAQGSRLLVTTRSNKVAISMRSEEHHLKVLKKDCCWELFAKHAFQSANPQPDPEFMEIGKKIVEKCNGLPLALKTMGSLLHNKSSFWEWESIMKSEIWDFSENESGILPALRLSYLHLPSHLKRCFAVCALFPKGRRFDKESLIQIWMAENFLESPLQKKSPKEVGEQYFNDLLSWSFFQQLHKEEEGWFIMHDLLNDLAKYVCENICVRLGVDEPKGIPTRHLSFGSVGDIYLDGFGSLIDTQKLHTFMLTGWHTCFNMSIEDLFSKFKFIRVLSLSGYHNLTEVPSSIGNLKHLRSLDLSSTDIEKLPDSITLLYKLQILKLNNCLELKELPSHLHKLGDLRCLEFIETGVKNVPAHLGKLKNLQVLMSSFYVEKSKEFGMQQLGELNLSGSLEIGGLQNIENPYDALEADLKNKPLLVELSLEWNYTGSSNENPVDSTKAEHVIENLRPPKRLKELYICNYVGKQFPKWLLDNSLPNLVTLRLRGCKSCQCFPPLGLLPFLKDLTISGFDEIVSIDADFHGNNSSSFKSLEKLELYDMRKWERWECKAVTGAFPRLQSLLISNCPKLKGELPEQPFPLKSLEISECKQLEAFVVSALQLKLRDCGKLQVDWATMKRLTMGGHIVSEISIEHLDICSHPQISDDDRVSLMTFPLDLFPVLTTLALSGFPNLQMISQDEAHKHLQHLRIRKCPKLESLPRNMHMLLPSLRRLQIEDCPRLESFPDGGLPSNLIDIELLNCSRLIGLLKGPWGANPRLEKLWIERVDAECFPDEGLLPLSLISLTIRDCQNLKALDYKGLNQLSSLQQLSLYCCPNLQRLPLYLFPKLRELTLGGFGNLQMISQDEAHNHLKHLRITQCPKLESLPRNMHMLLPSLFSLHIADCPRLESFPDGGLPSNLSYIELLNCSRLIGSLKGALGANPRLESLWIGRVDAKCFPDEGLLPLSLTSLDISNCQNLKELDYKGLNQLSSLQQLSLSCCPNLQRLPEEGLPKSISHFEIYNCPLLEERCQKEEGEDWEKIAHIQDLNIR